MCIGIPMQVMESGEITAVCEGCGRKEQINMLLVGEQPVGVWVMTFQGSALRVIDELEAQRTSSALLALGQAMQGDLSNIDALFSDLVNREPELPPHLRAEKE